MGKVREDDERSPGRVREVKNWADAEVSFGARCVRTPGEEVKLTACVWCRRRASKREKDVDSPLERQASGAERERDEERG